MRRPRYTLTDRDLGTDWEDAQGRTFTIMGWSHGKVALRYADSKADVDDYDQRLWRSALEARIDWGEYQPADRTAGRGL